MEVDGLGWGMAGEDGSWWVGMEVGGLGWRLVSRSTGKDGRVTLSASSLRISVSLERLSASFFSRKRSPPSALFPPRASNDAAESIGGDVRKSLGVPGVAGRVS